MPNAMQNYKPYRLASEIELNENEAFFDFAEVNQHKAFAFVIITKNGTKKDCIANNAFSFFKLARILKGMGITTVFAESVFALDGIKVVKKRISISLRSKIELELKPFTTNNTK